MARILRDHGGGSGAVVGDLLVGFCEVVPVEMALWCGIFWLGSGGWVLVKPCLFAKKKLSREYREGGSGTCLPFGGQKKRRRSRVGRRPAFWPATKTRRVAAGEIRAGLRDNWDMHVQVECYAGRKGDERPVRFQLDEHDYMVEEVLDQWFGPEHVFFKVRADDGGLYILRHETSVPDGDWELVSFREPSGG